MGWDGIDWMNLARNRDQWRVLVKSVIKFWIPYNVGKFLRAPQLAASQKGFSFMSEEWASLPH
jgi:hypothetical protein